MTGLVSATMTLVRDAGPESHGEEVERAMCLLRAAYDGHTDAVRYLVSLPEVDLNQQDYYYHTSLRAAAGKCPVHSVQLLQGGGKIFGG